MDEDESIAVENSEEEVEETEETPSEPTDTDTPSEETETVDTTEPEAELIELPDGRKVTADVVAQEYRNLLSDYTKKAQELAELRTPIESKPNPIDDPDFTPSSWAEASKLIREQTIAELAAKEQQQIEQQKAIETQVATQLDEIKKSDASLNENALFQHATKYGFRDLKLAHQNMKDMAQMAKTVQQTTEKNIAKRVDPVSSKPGATGAKLDPNSFRSAREYLAALKGQ